MNDHSPTIAGSATSWTIPPNEPDFSTPRPGRGAQELEDWRELTARVAAQGAANNWSKAEISRRSGVPEGTFSQWFSGKYQGRYDETNARIRQWLASVEEADSVARAVPQSPGFVETRTAREVMENLIYAQMMPDMVVITLAAGMGKTIACRQFCRTRPHAYLATMSPHTRTVHGMLTEIAAALDVHQPNPARLHRAIGDKLQRNGRNTLLIVDEAQNLVSEAIDQLRHLLDIHECGIALVGNEEVHKRFRGGEKKAGHAEPSYAQMKRRIGKRLRRAHPHAEDVAALLDAWRIQNPESRQFLTGIGNKPGALGQIDKTLKVAGLAAAGEGVAIAAKHIRAAWSNRSVED